MPNRFCPAHGVYTGRRCPACQRERDRARGSSSQRGYGSDWQATRAAFLAAHPHCSDGCGEPATEVDHIDGLGPNGPRGHDWANLRGFTKAHHSRRTALDQSGWGRRPG